MSPLMKAQTWKKRSTLAGNEMDMSGIRAMSWKILTRVHRDSNEDWLRMKEETYRKHCERERMAIRETEVAAIESPKA